MTSRKSTPGLSEDPDFDIDSVPGRLILAHMIESVHDHRIATEDVSERAAEEIARLERMLLEVMRLLDTGQAKNALALLLHQRAEIVASFYAERRRGDASH